MKTNKKMKSHHDLYERIEAHGKNLLAMFPDTLEADPIVLCKKLRRIESEAERRAVDNCNGVISCEQWEIISDKLAARANELLKTDRIWVNGDPRGYALKIDLKEGETLHRDWGGYGIIAPDFRE